MAKKLDEAQEREICAILSAGGSRETAAAYVGCGVESIRRAAERSAAFRDRLAQAEARCEVKLLAAVHEAAKSKTQWRAAIWMLERRWANRYAARPPDVITRQELAGAFTQLTELMLCDLPLEYRQKVVARIDELAASLTRPAKKTRRRKPQAKNPDAPPHALPPPD